MDGFVEFCFSISQLVIFHLQVSMIRHFLILSELFIDILLKFENNWQLLTINNHLILLTSGRSCNWYIDKNSD